MNTTEITLTTEQGNVINFLNGSKELKQAVKNIIEDQILFNRISNSFVHISTVISGMERDEFQPEYKFNGLTIACNIIGVYGDVRDKIFAILSEVGAADFNSNPTERISHADEAKLFYKKVKKLLKEFVQVQKAA